MNLTKKCFVVIPFASTLHNASRSTVSAPTLGACVSRISALKDRETAIVDVCARIEAARICLFRFAGSSLFSLIFASNVADCQKRGSEW
jgi:hypothetical protein